MRRVVGEERYCFRLPSGVSSVALNPQRVSENDGFGEREARWPEAFRGQDHF
jgi:hypothetical protein